MKRNITILLAFFCCFWVVYLGLQNNFVYQHTLGKVAKNWVNEDGERRLKKVPYCQINNENVVHWDAVHYQLIKNSGFAVEKAGGDYIFAFFPLFPAIWRISHLPPIGIIFLNFILFSIAILTLLKLLTSKEQRLNNLLVSLILPSVIIFFIPYTEATFILMVSIAIYGFFQDKYWIYFIGMFLASITRPSYSILMISIVATEFFFYLISNEFKNMAKNLFFRILPLIIGTAIVTAIQWLSGSGSIFKFIEVQKYWDNIPSIPHNLRDWSLEGFSINLGIIFLIAFPLLWVVIIETFKNLIKKKDTSHKNIEQLGYKKFYLIVLSAIYLIGNALFVILFRGGSLHCLFRFTLCSPFAYVLLFSSFNLVAKTAPQQRMFAFFVLSSLALFMLGLSNFSTYWDFSDFGFFMLTATLFMWLFQDYRHMLIYRLALPVLLFLNLIWTTYLFNMYVIDGWIFA
jgi:hypothetical protein